MYSSFRFIERLLASEIAKPRETHTVLQAGVLRLAFPATALTARSQTLLPMRSLMSLKKVSSFPRRVKTTVWNEINHLHYSCTVTFVLKQHYFKCRNTYTNLCFRIDFIFFKVYHAFSGAHLFSNSSLTLVWADNSLHELGITAWWATCEQAPDPNSQSEPVRRSSYP